MNMTTITIAVVQFTPILGARARNMDAMKAILSGVVADLIVLPELSTSGYSFISREEAVAAAEDLEGIGVVALRALAESHRAVVVAGFAERGGAPGETRAGPGETRAGSERARPSARPGTEPKVYNSALIALPDSRVRVYRKSHLFAREKDCFDPGDSGFFVTEHPLKDCRIGVMVCNDWRYPEASRALALGGADVIACPSNLVSSTWQIGMAARALENKVYVAVANRCGEEIRQLPDGSTQELRFTGRSVVYDLNGQPLVQAGPEESRVLTVEIDPGATRDKSFNRWNDLFLDRRVDLY